MPQTETSAQQTRRPQQYRYKGMVMWRNLLVFVCVGTLSLFWATASKTFAGREDSEQNRVAEQEVSKVPEK